MPEKRHAPATLRNRDAIADVLRQELPPPGTEPGTGPGIHRRTVLEIASGSGEHAVYFARAFPQLDWQPSDPDPDALDSIRAWRADATGENLRDPVMLDARAPASWPIDSADAIVCINMVHISPWDATIGLFEGAAHILGSKGGPVILYGPYFEQDTNTAPSNLEFDESLRLRNGQWGIRQIEDVDALARRHGFARSARYEMPANNLTLVYRPN